MNKSIKKIIVYSTFLIIGILFLYIDYLSLLMLLSAGTGIIGILIYTTIGVGILSSASFAIYKEYSEVKQNNKKVKKK